ncbi:MAG: thioesterase family protein [candidate division KSB1 bacterium]|nr:thioesterase family protein [candidate division KSB1 bacterium]
MKKNFSYETSIKFHETDAAGRLFFAHQLKLAHDAYEAFLQTSGLPLAIIVQDRPYDLPIVHAESDYLAPLFVGDKIRIELTVERIGNSSFTLGYDFRGQNGQSVGRAKTVHVAVNSKTGEKMALPEEVRRILE